MLKKTNPMTIELLRTLFDFGLVILIWLVQLVIYPSFKFFKPADLYRFHKSYTLRIAVIVMPLMVGQLLFYTYFLFKEQSVFNVLGFLIVILLWASTFFQFVPLHGEISNNTFTKITLNQLVHRNWLRTFFWTLLFTASLSNYLLNY
ncbi:MAG: hypothetical protein AAF688_12875 [Bacteroidota bacterium]